MRWIYSLASALVLSLALAVTATPAFAHEKWFQNASEFPLRWDLFSRPLPLALFVAVLIATLGAGLLWRARDGRSFIPGPEAFGATDERRSTLYALAPLILGVHIAVPLLFNGVQGQLFTPDNQMPGA